MNIVQVKDGRMETVSCYRDICDIVREKCGDDVANLLWGGDYDYHKLYEAANEAYDKYYWPTIMNENREFDYEQLFENVMDMISAEL